MKLSHRTLHVPDYAVLAGSDWSSPAAGAKQTKAQAAARPKARGGINASAKVAYVLMLATSVMALIDLYLLSSVLPR